MLIGAMVCTGCVLFDDAPPARPCAVPGASYHDVIACLRQPLPRAFLLDNNKEKGTPERRILRVDGTAVFENFFPPGSGV